MKYIFIIVIFSLGCSRNEKRTENSETKTLTKETCDSIPKNYLHNINFPFSRLDSLSEANIDTRQYLEFGMCDNLLFKNDRTDIQTLNYISLQDSIDYYVVLVFRQMDMENCVFMYSIDKDNKLIDSKILFCETGGLDRQSDVLINGKIVNTLTQEKKAVFSDNKYVSIDREFFTIRDTLTKETITEIGQQKIIEYQLDKSGRFKITKNDSFEKEYSKVKYWYN